MFLINLATLNLSALLWRVLFLFGVVWYGQYRWKNRRLYREARKIPGPKVWPLVGNFLRFMGDMKVVHEVVMGDFRHYPNIFRWWIGPKLAVCVSKPEYLEKVVKSGQSLSKSYFYKFTEKVTGPGLFSAPVPKWRAHRRVIEPAFNQRILDDFVKAFNRVGIMMCTILEEKHLGKEFDTQKFTLDIAMEAFCETNLGISNLKQEVKSELALCVDRLIDLVMQRMFALLYHFDFTYKWTQLYQQEKKDMEMFTNFAETVIKYRVMTKQNKKESAGAFLDAMIDAGLSFREMRDEVCTFVAGGCHSLAGEISLVLLALALHSDVQDRIFKEVMEVLGPDKDVEPQHLSLLEYTERAIKEALRLFPPGYIIGREVLEDLPLEDDLTLCKGTTVVLGFLQVQRSELYWKDPLKFDADRFLPEEVAKRHPFAYMPFSGGSRNCIGYRYSMTILKTLVPLVIRKFRLTTSYKSIEDVKLTGTMLLKTVNGYNIAFHLRK